MVQTAQRTHLEQDLIDLRDIIDGKVISDGTSDDASYSDGNRYELIRTDKKDGSREFYVDVSETQDYTGGNGEPAVGASRMVLRFSQELKVLDAYVGSQVHEDDSNEGLEKEITKNAQPSFVAYLLRQLQDEL